MGSTVVRTGQASSSGYDEIQVLGFNEACSVALRYFSYPPAGHGLQGVPDAWRIGDITLPPDDTRTRESWRYDGLSQDGWLRGRAEQAAQELLLGGYTRPGSAEKIRDAPTAAHPTLERVLRSTSVFELGYRTDWPPPSYRLARVHYHPLGNCALLLFRDPLKPRDSWRWKLARLLNPEARRQRARAHVTNGLLLYKAADIYGALEELSIAADMAPEYAVARYHHAVLLGAHGRLDEAFVELKAAVALQSDFKGKARAAEEFEGLRRRPDFQSLVRKPGHRWIDWGP